MTHTLRPDNVDSENARFYLPAGNLVCPPAHDESGFWQFQNIFFVKCSRYSAASLGYFVKFYD